MWSKTGQKGNTGVAKVDAAKLTCYFPCLENQFTKGYWVDLIQNVYGNISGTVDFSAKTVMQLKELPKKRTIG